MAEITSEKFRQVMGSFPTGVTVITADLNGDPKGFSVGSFASLSLDPPLVMFGAGKSSTSWPDIEAAGSFCVNVLADDQSEISNLFASKAEDKFADIKYTTRETGAPVLNGVVAWIDCSLENVAEGGDHWIVVGRVLDMEIEDENKLPLLFLKGGYGSYKAHK